MQNAILLLEVHVNVMAFVAYFFPDLFFSLYIPSVPPFVCVSCLLNISPPLFVHNQHLTFMFLMSSSTYSS